MQGDGVEGNMEGDKQLIRPLSFPAKLDEHLQGFLQEVGKNGEKSVPEPS